MILITGGERSGKSRLALELALKKGEKRAFIATAEAIDEEMSSRIAKHKEERGNLFDTYEEPLDIHAILKKTGDYDVVVVECMTTWLENLFHYDRNIDEMVEKFIASINGNEIIVSNEIGMGVIPENPLTRTFVEALGRLNARIAQIADEVYFVVSGIGVKIK